MHQQEGEQTAASWWVLRDFFFFTYPLFFRYMWGNLSERDNSMWFQVIGIRSYGASNNVILCRSLRGIVFVLLCGKVRMEDKPQHNILV